jgi:hypothetical protein
MDIIRLLHDKKGEYDYNLCYLTNYYIILLFIKY